VSQAPETEPSPQQAQPGAETIIDPESTVGTGSVFAIGCTVLMLIVLIIGLAIFFT
jgi:hypothetical protein